MHFLIGLFLASCIYFFISYLLQLFALKKANPKSTTPDISAGVSVVVCAQNEEANLRKLVPALLAQDYENKEIIIVDDRSHDESYDYLLSMKPNIKLVRIEHVPDHANGKKFGLTMGIKAAANDRIVFTDADCMPASTQWLSQIAASFTPTSKFVIGYSQYQKMAGLLNLFIRFETITTALHYIMRGVLFKPYMAVGRNLAYRKSMFMVVKGFNTDLKKTGGDDDLMVNKYAKSKETNFLVSPESTVYSVPKASWGSYYTQKKRHLSIGKYYRISDKVVLGFRAMMNLVFWGMFFATIVLYGLNYFVIAGFAIKLLLQGILIFKMTKKSGEKFDFWIFPLLDLFYSLYLATMGVVASVSKKIRWS